MNGLTINEIAKILNISVATAHKRIARAGIKPLTYKAIYDTSVVNAIENPAKGGRPKKSKEK